MGYCGYINHHRLFICEKKTSFERGEIIHTYTLVDKAFLFTPKAFNDNISGLSLAGTVVKAQKESVYIQLNIDKDKSNADYPFDWAPLTGNIMYCMPKLGTSVSVHFPTNDESLARAVTSPRSSNTGSGFQNTANRGIITEHGKQLDLYPGRMGLQSTGGSLDITDETGIMFSSQSAITMVANGKIHFEATNININIPLEIQMLQSGNYASAIANTVVPAGTGIAKVGVLVAPTMVPTAMATESSVSLCNQFDFVGGNGTRFYGCTYIPYNPFDDAPTEGKLNWGKLALKALAAVAVVMVATAVFAATGGLVLGATLWTVAKVAVACGAIAAVATVSIKTANGGIDGWDEMGYCAVDAFLNGVITGAVSVGLSPVWLATLTPKMVSLIPYIQSSIATVSSMLVDDIFDKWLGYDFYESEKSICDYLYAIAISLGATAITNQLTNLITQRYADKMVRLIQEGKVKAATKYFKEVLKQFGFVGKGIHPAMKGNYVLNLSEYPLIVEFFKGIEYLLLQSGIYSSLAGEPIGSFVNFFSGLLESSEDDTIDKEIEEIILRFVDEIS